MKKGFSPSKYYSDIDIKPFCHHCHERHRVEAVEQVVIGTKRGTTFPANLQGTLCNALIDTGATKSCVSESYFKTLSKQNLKELQRVMVRSSGSNLAPISFATCKLTLGNKTFENDLIVCKHLMRPLILGRDFVYENELKVFYVKNGDCKLEYKNEELVVTVDIKIELALSLKIGVTIPPRNIAILNVVSNLEEEDMGQIFNIRPNDLLSDEYPQLQIIPSIHKVDRINNNLIPFLMINLREDSVYLPKGHVVGFLESECIDISEIMTENMATKKVIDEKYDILEEKNLEQVTFAIPSDFITSPADVEGPRKAELQDYEVTEEELKSFQELCDKYSDVFSEISGNIGKTPLIQMNIVTGDSPLVCQRPYTLPLKYAEWVKHELNILEAAGIIVRSVSPWAIPIVVVPKRSAPGEPPKRRMCVDYRALNKLLPLVKKTHSNAKGVLSLVPLPKIDEIYAKLKDSKVFSTLDMRSGYHHVEMTKEARPKTAFTLPANLGKWEFLRCPFGLAQASAYFQRLINEVLAPFDFAFGYLDDILIYSPDVATHLKHLEQIFERLHEVDLKLKMEKCSFLTKHIQYLGHIVSGDGIRPVP